MSSKTFNAFIEVERITVARPECFSQVCLMPGTFCYEVAVPDFEAWFASKGFRVKFLENVTTKPDIDDVGDEIPDTGGRTDILFAIHRDDVFLFSTWRFQVGIRWIEDVLAHHNHTRHMYDCNRLENYMTWDPTESPETIKAVKQRHGANNSCQRR